MQWKKQKIIISNCSTNIYLFYFSSIDITMRCDGSVNCLDKSDEIDWHKIRLDESYLKDYPPAPIKMGEGTVVSNQLCFGI